MMLSTHYFSLRWVFLHPDWLLQCGTGKRLYGAGYADLWWLALWCPCSESLEALKPWSSHLIFALWAVLITLYSRYMLEKGTHLRPSLKAALISLVSVSATSHSCSLESRTLVLLRISFSWTRITRWTRYRFVILHGHMTVASDGYRWHHLQMLQRK